MEGFVVLFFPFLSRMGSGYFTAHESFQRFAQFKMKFSDIALAVAGLSN